MREWISGRNPVYEVLAARRRQVFRLRLAVGVKETGRISEIVARCRSQKVTIDRVPRSDLDGLGTNHQGVAIQVSGFPYTPFPDILRAVGVAGDKTLLLVLDMIQDPQNLGTLLRTAEAFGVQGVLLPLRRTATVTPAVIQASAGASEHLSIVQINLAQAIARLKEQGVWVIGLDNEPSAAAPDQVRMDGPLALVVGHEGSGIRRLVRDSCDVILRLPMIGQIGSLNAAVAGSIALYLAWQDRKAGET
jgi:23S rRNA (guanosine2251-2'-O)-methyltransferase